MSKINSRAKGQTGEREVADMLNGAVFRATGTYGDFKRNLQQTQDGGFDLFSEAFPFFAIEVKRVENITPAVLDKFWEQAKRQATAFNPLTTGKALLPILLYRKNRADWRARTYGTIAWDDTALVVDITGEALIAWFERQIRRIHEARSK